MLCGPGRVRRCSNSQNEDADGLPSMVSIEPAQRGSQGQFLPKKPQTACAPLFQDTPPPAAKHFAPRLVDEPRGGAGHWFPRLLARTLRTVFFGKPKQARKQLSSRAPPAPPEHLCGPRTPSWTRPRTAEEALTCCAGAFLRMFQSAPDRPQRELLATDAGYPS